MAPRLQADRSVEPRTPVAQDRTGPLCSIGETDDAQSFRGAYGPDSGDHCDGVRACEGTCVAAECGRSGGELVAATDRSREPGSASWAVGRRKRAGSKGDLHT